MNFFNVNVHPGLIFAGKARVTLVGSSLAPALPYTWVKVTVSVRHSNLQLYGINYGRKKFYVISVWSGANVIKTFKAVSYDFSQ